MNALWHRGLSSSPLPAQKSLYKLLSLILLFSLTKEVTAMSIGEKLCLMSEISGTITLNGEPAAGAKLKRKVRKAYSRSYVTDETTTDDNGYFAMPAIIQRKVLPSLIPAEFVVPSEIYVTYRGTEYFVWTSTKRKPEINVENRGKPLVVQCELSNKERGFMIDGSFFTTICTWDIEVDPPYEFGPPGSGN